MDTRRSAAVILMAYGALVIFSGAAQLAVALADSLGLAFSDNSMAALGFGFGPAFLAVGGWLAAAALSVWRWTPLGPRLGIISGALVTVVGALLAVVNWSAWSHARSMGASYSADQRTLDALEIGVPIVLLLSGAFVVWSLWGQERRGEPSTE